MKILVVDDDPVSLKMLEVAAKSLGHEVACVTSAEQAWERFRASPVPIVISDWVMPGMSGPELCRRIRESQQQHYTYFVLVTSKSDRESLLAGFEAGADDFLSKPVDREELQARLRSGGRLVSLETQLADRVKELDAAYGRMKQDLQAAASLQQALLPYQGAKIEKCGVAWRLRPCEELAGDILNYFVIGGHYLAFYLVDVSGHGVAASLWAVTLSRQLVPIPGPSVLLGPGEPTLDGQVRTPAAVLERLNSQYTPPEGTHGHFFTIAYCLLDLDSGSLRFCVAAHPQPVVVRTSGQLDVLSEGNMAIGLIKEATFQEGTVQLGPGDRVFIYSDGVPEASSPDDSFLGDDAVADHIRATRSESLDSSAQHLVDRVCEWCSPSNPQDDVSVIAVEWQP